MPRLIDADALLKSAGIFEAKMCARGCGKSILHLAKAWLWNEVNKATTIDAVPVVRCGQCKHWKTADDHCTHPAGLCATGKKARNNYCILGERKDGEG